MEDHFNIAMPALANLDKEEAKADQKLRDDIAEAKAKRLAAQAEVDVLQSRYSSCVKQRYPLMPQHTAVQRGEALTTLADGLQARWRFFCIERDLLESEIPLLNRVMSEYCSLANRVESRQRAIAMETVELAKQAVRDEFIARYNPKVFPADAGGLERYVETHPIVVAAQRQASELAITNYSSSTRQAAHDALYRMEPRLAGLEGSIKRAHELLMNATVQRDEAVEQAEASLRQQQAGAEKQRKEEELVKAEAKRQLTQAMKSR